MLKIKLISISFFKTYSWGKLPEKYIRLIEFLQPKYFYGFITIFDSNLYIKKV